MGQHAGIGKADFARFIQAENLKPSQYEAHFMEFIMKRMPRYTRNQLRDQIGDLLL